MKYLSDFSSGRDNNFNLLRFVAATAVLVSHSFALATGDSSSEPLRKLLGLSLGDIAVSVFFATSGFLVCGSLLTKKSATDFFVARALRIYPGLWVAVLLTVMASGVIFTELSANAFFAQRGTWRYALSNMLMLGGETYDLPGTFAKLPIKGAVNGSLWSLPVEIRMYLLLGLGWIVFSRLTKAPGQWLAWFCAAVAAIALAVDLQFLWAHQETYEAYKAPFYAELTTAFFSGATLRAFQHRVPVSFAMFTGIVVALVLSAVSSGFLWLYKLSFAYVVLYLALVPRGWALKFNRTGDYSYGIYIYAFAVQQALVFAIPGISAVKLLICSFPLTLVLAMLSWHLVEKRGLTLRHLYTERKSSRLQSIEGQGTLAGGTR
jgi:peptidoglycan/LPS O-acetylase OafA/YrhL